MKKKIHYTFPLKTVLFFLLAFYFHTQALYAAQPKWVRLSYTGHPTSEAISVSFTTDSSTLDGTGQDVCYVEYGTETDYPWIERCTQTEVGGDVGFTHTAEIQGLLAGTVYQYRVTCGSDHSDNYNFSTGPTNTCETFRFGVMGDNRSQLSGSASGYGQLMQDMVNIGAELLINTGDMVKDGSEVDQWKGYLEASGLPPAFVPVMPTLGNHDDGPGEGDEQNYAKVFATPRNSSTQTEDFYSFDYGNAHFVVLSMYSYEDNNFQIQTEWLEQDLAATDKPWKFVFFHPPFYTCALNIFGFEAGHEGDEQGVGDQILPIFDRYHVDMAFSGHNHFYELFKPIYNGHGVEDPAEGTVHITTGGGAKGEALAMLGALNFTCDDRINQTGNLHFVTVEITGHHLDLYYHDEGGRFGGSLGAPQLHYTIDKPGDPVCYDLGELPPVDGDIDEEPEMEYEDEAEPEIVAEQEIPEEPEEEIPADGDLDEIQETANEAEIEIAQEEETDSTEVVAPNGGDEDSSSGVTETPPGTVSGGCATLHPSAALCLFPVFLILGLLRRFGTQHCN